MDEFGSSVVMMILGAFLGSIISPASEMVFAKIFAKNNEEYSIGNGLILLCAANAAWVISFILFQSSKVNESTLTLYATFFLYTVAASLLIASFSQFRKSEIASTNNNHGGILLFLVLGNLLWLVAESSEVILKLFDLDSFPHLSVKYMCLTASALLFIGGIISFCRGSGKNA